MKALHKLKTVFPRRPTTKNTQQAVETEVDYSLFPDWPPIGPAEILANREAYRQRLFLRKYRGPYKVFEDSPLFGLYRLYEWIMADHYINIRNELECFWWERWPVASIPDPADHGITPESDPQRYAVMASIPALLVESFNQRIDLGLRRQEPHSILSLEEQLAWAATPKEYEKEPEWTSKPAGVAALPETLVIPHSHKGWTELTDINSPDAAESFRERNILLAKPHIYFI